MKPPTLYVAKEGICFWNISKAYGARLFRPISLTYKIRAIERAT